MAWGRWILFVTVLLGAQARTEAASAEERAFTSAVSALFRDGFYDWAEEAFGKFAQKYPQSPRLPEAILYQAEARIKLANYTGAIELLSGHMNQAGRWADEYLFWLAQAQFNNNEAQTAARTFATLVGDFPASPRRLEAIIGQADALSRLAQWPQVISLLESSNGVFQSAARSPTGTELAPAGYLLLGEANLSLKQYRAAEAALQPLASLLLSPTNSWAEQYLLCRIAVADGRIEAALQTSTNLLAAAAKAGRRDLQAASVAFEAGLRERLGQTNEAILTFQKNLPAGFPAEWRRQALLKITELSLAENKLAEAAGVLEQFLNEYPQAPMVDLALLTLGDIRLRQHLQNHEAPRIEPGATNAVANPTNRLEQAVTAFSVLTNKFPQSSLVGKAQLELGWCFWLQGRFADSEQAFAAATQRLPRSADQATAYFKLADAQLAQKHFANAIANYGTLISRFASLPEATTNFFEPALYQTVRAGLEGGDVPAATNALAKILAWYPKSFITASAVLVAGQAISRQGDPAGARKLFLNFMQRAPDSPLLPEVKLAIARTYEQENKWAEAIHQYDGCLNGPTNSEARARAEYWRAWANDQAGRQTNALMLFTNFVAEYPNDPLTPRAKWWLADYYLRCGSNVLAETIYQQIFGDTNLQSSPLAFEAELWAGRAAFARQGWRDARDYFTNLTSNLNCPLDLRVEAMFALGDTYMHWGQETNRLANYGEAIKVFTAISESYPSNRLAVLALGQKANCLLQWGQFDSASNAYQQVIESPLADANARGDAKVGLAVVLEKQAADAPAAERMTLLKRALDECLDVLLGESREPDAYWVKEAGMKALRLAETMSDWESTIKICKKLAELIPSLRPSLEERRLKAEKNLEDKG